MIRDIFFKFLIQLLIFSLILLIIIYYSIFYDREAFSNMIIYKYRFYRVIEATLAGFILGLSGSYLQASLRNPLVDHYILGIGGGALFSVYLAYLLLSMPLYMYSLVAVIGGLSALSLTVLIAESIGGGAVAYVLSGLGVNSLFSGLSFLLSYYILVKNPYAIQLLMGSFVIATPDYLPLIIISLAIVVSGYIPLAKPLNALMLGDEYSLQLGYNPRIYRLASIIIAGLSSSIIVGYFGLIGFLGLVSPHIVRFLMGSSDNRYVIPLSGLISSILLLLTDDFSRIYLSTRIGEVPAGAIVSVIGAPFFLLLIIRRFRSGGAY